MPRRRSRLPFRLPSRQRPSAVRPALPPAALARIALLLGLMMLGLLAAPAWAQAGRQLVHAQAAFDHKPLVAGATAQLAVTVTIDQGYHIQSARPHDEFLIPTRLTITPVPGLTFGPVRYPQHQEIAANGLSTDSTLAVYEHTVYLLVPVTIAPDAAPGAHTVELALRTQACNDTSCYPPTTQKLSVPVTIAAAGTASAANEPELFQKVEAQKFLPAKNAAPATEPAASQPGPAAGMVAPPGAGSPAGADATGTAAEVAAIAARAYRPANLTTGEHSLWGLALLALAGGVILNIMPCVLPVIPLKVLTIVQQSHGNRRDAVLHATVFAAGIIVLFIALAAFLGSYRYFGGENLYGKQFQSPAFLIGMAMLVLVLALSMLGVWTINPPRAVFAAESARANRADAFAGGVSATHDGGALPYAAAAPRASYANAFFMGVLATLLATPCSAPLLGPVLAWALVQPLAVTMIAFGLVGVGMAVPYVVLAAFPGWLSRLPRAGRWSELLKQGLGIVMVGVAIYLITLLDQSYWPWVLIGGVIAGGVCWGWGQIPTASMSRGRVWIIRGTVVAIGALLTVGLVRFATPSAGELAWQPFSVAALDQGLSSGRPVVIDWTANWCINCRAVEATVLTSTPVQQAFRRHNALLLRADLSNGNPPAETLLAKLDARAIPVLAIFSPRQPLEPTVLRDLYSRDRVITVLGQAATGTPTGPVASVH